VNVVDVVNVGGVVKKGYGVTRENFFYLKIGQMELILKIFK